MPPTIQSMSSFDGVVLESAPAPVADDDSLDPFVSDISSDGVIEFGFPEPILADESEITQESAVPARRLQKLIIDDQSRVYRKIQAFEISLKSSNSDEAKPIDVEWELIDFDGQIGHIQMDLKQL